MDLEMSSEQAAFRDEVRQWLADEAPSEPLQDISTPEGMDQHRAWENKLNQAGLAAVHWPVEYGGRGLGPMSTLIFNEEYARAGAPERLNRHGLGLAGPTLIAAGTPEQQERWLPRILTSEDIWCQGFSEPGAGSDLAGIRTRGVIEGDELVVTGEKLWTSRGVGADWIFALVRTSTEPDKRHAGITFVMIDLKTEGVTVSPIRQINGEQEFAQVYFDEARVPLDNVIGEVGDGWRVAMITLSHERGNGAVTATQFIKLLEELIGMIREHEIEETLVVEQIGRLYEEITALKYMFLRTISELEQGKKPGPQSAMGKLWWSEMQTRLYKLGGDVLGELAEIHEFSGGHDLHAWWKRAWYARAATIFAGTSEIQRNIISERVLKLPKGANRAV